ncbi:hypothetical protein FRB99_000651 [Tulasnella sp. 403]|nr:hypothetical protein FRB99_000651 [Tulasnella sp. 403]
MQAQSLNTALSPQTLPNELVHEILFYSLENQVNYPRALHERAQVCVVWRDMVLSERRFWTIIEPRWGRQWAIWAIQKSGDLPLSIFSIPTGADDGVWEHDCVAPFQEIADVIESVPHRCRLLAFSPEDFAWDDQFDIERFLQEALVHSALEAFDIRPVYKSICPANYIRGPTPTFRDLIIPDALLWKLYPIMTDLTHLEIWDEGGQEITFDWLFDVLRSSPRLRSLCLDVRCITWRAKPAAQDLSPISLPSLATLELPKISPDAIGTMLRVIDAPMCSKASLGWNSEDLEVLFSLPKERLVVKMTSALSHAEKFGIVSTSPKGGVAVSLVTPKISFDWEFPLGHSERPPDISRLIQCNFPSLTSLNLDLNVVAVELVPSLVAKMPSVESLTLVTPNPAEWGMVMTALTGASDAPLSWPRLHTLIVEGHRWKFVPLPFLDFLRRRVHVNMDDGSQPTTPKFRKLSIYGQSKGFDDAVRAEIEALVDDFKLLILCK